jgi:hypothetical protein
MKTNNVTGRDGFIIAKALAYAIATIQALPEHMQEYSDMCDMCEILRSFPEGMALSTAFSVFGHTEHILNLFPEDPEAQSRFSASMTDFLKFVRDAPGAHAPGADEIVH